MGSQEKDVIPKEGTKIYKFGCPYCNKMFEGSERKFNVCFTHIMRSHSREHRASPCYPINHCRVFHAGKWWSFIP